MKKIVILILMLNLFSCSMSTNKNQSNLDNKEIINENEKVIKFYSIDNKVIYLRSLDNFETAILEEQGLKIKLFRESSASGVIMKNEGEQITIFYSEHKFAGIKKGNLTSNLFIRPLVYRDYIHNNDKISLAKVNEEEIVIKIDEEYKVLNKLYTETNDKEYLSLKNDIKLIISDEKLILEFLDIDENVIKKIEFDK